MRLLIIEDDPILALAFASTLEGADHAVVGVAYNAEEALEIAAQEEGIDLALMDINLEGNDEGIDLARQLRTRFGIPSLFVSGQIAVAQANADVALGLMRKPFPPADLRRAVEAVAYARIGSPQPVANLPPALTLFTTAR